MTRKRKFQLKHVLANDHSLQWVINALQYNNQYLCKADRPIRTKQTRTRCTPKICAVLLALRKAKQHHWKKQSPRFTFCFSHFDFYIWNAKVQQQYRTSTTLLIHGTIDMELLCLPASISVFYNIDTTYLYITRGMKFIFQGSVMVDLPYRYSLICALCSLSCTMPY